MGDVKRKMMQIKMKNQAAPQSFLSIIRCNCKTNCGNKRCTKKNALDCNVSCGECQGQNCSNSECVPMENDEAIEYKADYFCGGSGKYVQNIKFLLIQKEYFFMSRGAVCLML